MTRPDLVQILNIKSIGSCTYSKTIDSCGRAGPVRYFKSSTEVIRRVRDDVFVVTAASAQRRGSVGRARNRFQLRRRRPRGGSKALGDRKPASSLIVSGLANQAWKIEVEGVAVARSGRGANSYRPKGRRSALRGRS
jgi:hypothetical protein